MNFTRKLMEFGIGALTIVLVAGILAAGLTGSNKPFDPAPVLALVNWFWSNAQEGSQIPPSEDPEPFTDVLQDGVTATREQFSEAIGDPEIIPGLQSDPRLASCPTGSIAHDRPISLNLAQSFVEAAPDFLDLIEAQSLLGDPSCSYDSNSTYKYLVEGGRTLTVSQSGDTPGLEVNSVGF